MNQRAMKKPISIYVLALAALIAGSVLARFSPSSLVVPNPADVNDFSVPELRGFAGMQPIDTHAHVFKQDSTFYAMMDQLHLHLLDICVANRNDPNFPNLPSKIKAAKAFVKASNGRAVLCTTFDPFKFSDATFPEQAIQQLNADFADGAVAVKIWKNIGMELKDSKRAFVVPDDPRFESIYKDISAHG